MFNFKKSLNKFKKKVLAPTNNSSAYKNINKRNNPIY
jgi:hypothetical protein